MPEKFEKRERCNSSFHIPVMNSASRANYQLISQICEDYQLLIIASNHNTDSYNNKHTRGLRTDYISSHSLLRKYHSILKSDIHYVIAASMYEICTHISE